MKELTFLVFSDIHYGKDADSSDFTVDAVPPKGHIKNAVSKKQNLVGTLTGKQFNGLFVLGDITSVGAPAEFVGCSKVVHEIANQLKINRNNVMFSYGNHDVNWHISKLADLEEKDSLYLNVAASTGAIFCKNQDFCDAHDIPGTGVFIREDFVVFVANSGYYSTHNQEYSHGKLGPEQLAWLRGAIDKHSSASKWNILVLHHHPFNYPYPTAVEDISCLTEGAELVDLIGQSKIDIVCHGHRHHAKLHTAWQTGWVYPKTFFCAGSLAVTAEQRDNGEIPNTFHTLTLEKRTKTGAAFGNVTTYQYGSGDGWAQVRKSRVIPLDPVQKFGSLATSIEMQSLAQKIVQSALPAAVTRALLPSLDLLPEELQCVSLSDLNKLFPEVCKKMGVMLTGKYPDEVLVHKI